MKGRKIMKPHIRTLSLLAGCGLSFLLIPLAQATTMTDEFFVQFVIPEWCQISSTHASKTTFNEKNRFTITFIRDPQNNGTLTEVEARFISIGGVSFDLEEIIMKGVGYLTNNAGTAGEFSVSGVHPGDPAVFLTFRGKFILDKLGLVKKISGFFVYHSLDNNGNCIATGRFKTLLPAP
jgi:hypothetical protein